MRQAFGRGFWVGSALAGAMTASKGKFPPRDLRLERDAEQELITTDRARRIRRRRQADVRQALVGLRLRNKTRDDQPSHIRIQTRVPREVAELWAHMCPAQVYEVGAEDAGKVAVQVTPSNCVQCGAITAKGGRLTPPEGGSGPGVHALLDACGRC